MPRDHPHPLALFSLCPVNDRAWAVLEHPENAHLVSTFIDKDNAFQHGINIGFHIGSKSRYTLATIGRCGDIIVEGAGISRIQCSFEIHDGNDKEILLQDRSSNKTTHFFGETAMSFEPGRIHRRVVVDPQVNLALGFGGVACNLYQFRIFWHVSRELDVPKLLEYREDNPRQSRTVLHDPPTVAPSGPATRIHTPGSWEQIRYSKRQKLGCGTFGEVWKVADVDTGDYFAVKLVERPPLQTRNFVMLKREVETLSRISHRHIIEYRAAQWEEKYLAIIMDLKPGSVEDLIRKDVYINETSLTNALLHHMLQALDYLACEGIIHRDVKPENILCSPLSSGGYEYQLADFGLANLAADARTYAGTAIYMAPELEFGPRERQTPKMDVWSLFVTLTYALDAASFRSKPLHTVQLRIKAVQDAADSDMLRTLRRMANTNPSQRASAADMLDELYGGEGRTTPRSQQQTGAAGEDGTGPGPHRRRIEPERPAVTERRARNPVETVEQRQMPQNEAVATTTRRKRTRVGIRAAQNQVAGPADQTRPADQTPATSEPTIQKQDAPR